MNDKKERAFQVERTEREMPCGRREQDKNKGL